MSNKWLVTMITVSLCGVAWADFSDEYQTSDDSCVGEDVFQCHDRGCVSLDQYCDGRDDCADRSDENYCPNHHAKIAACNASHEYLCKDGSKCIPYPWMCNNEPECSDGSDEADCSSVAAPKEDDPCQGFQCRNGQCISRLWVCDGVVDCYDSSDEYNDVLCRTQKDFERYSEVGSMTCEPQDFLSHRQYMCDDHSFCLLEYRMCDGVADCRDRGDEGPFCANWTTMCNNVTCGLNATCRPNAYGPTCECDVKYTYDVHTGACVDRDECAAVMAVCAQRCDNYNGGYSCTCDPGYRNDSFMCFTASKAIEPLLIFSTRRDIRYINLKTKAMVVVASDLKQAHGVTYDGSYLYWVETEAGHQAIVRAQLDNVRGTKQTLVALGLEQPGDISVDWLAGHFYFTDSARRHIAACLLDGSICTVLNTTVHHPRFLTLHPQAGEMYWSDHDTNSVIMKANMDGSGARVFVDKLSSFATGLTIDIPGMRLYFVDRGLHVAPLDGRGRYVLLSGNLHHPYSVSVYETAAFFSDWASNSIQLINKIMPSVRRKRIVSGLDMPVLGIHMYHPILMQKSRSGCDGHTCSELCLPRGAGYVCACSQGRKLVSRTMCSPASFAELPQFLIVGGGSHFTRVRYNSLGNPESRAVRFDIGRVQALAYNNFRRVLYVYDSQRKSINFIHMNNFSTGVTNLLAFKHLENVVDMDYDYVTDNLYVLDSGRQTLEVVNTKSKERAIVHKFREYVPIALSVMPEYGRAMVALKSEGPEGGIQVDSIGLNGHERINVVENYLQGPQVRLRYSGHEDKVYISDEGNGRIYSIHPSGTGKELYRDVSTKITSVAVSDDTIFWTDRHTPRLFWSHVHDVSTNVRRLEMTIFPKHSQLIIQSTSFFQSLKSPILTHPCFQTNPCSHVCTQTPHPKLPNTNNTSTPIPKMGYMCLCPPGMVLMGNKCQELSSCKKDEVICLNDNKCVDGHICDGVKDCKDGSDENGCDPQSQVPPRCGPEQKLCHNFCVDNKVVCVSSDIQPNNTKLTCTSEEFQCRAKCIPRYKVCDLSEDCPGGEDESAFLCRNNLCRDEEWRCQSGACIPSSWRCDRHGDCADETDEVNCEYEKCKDDEWQCGDGSCIDFSRRCDDVLDCDDHSDEEACDNDDLDDSHSEESPCEDFEYTCAMNRSICLPLTAVCNGTSECPNGTDEAGCDSLCPPHMFHCRDDRLCLPPRKVCDGKVDCKDGSDEAPKNSCNATRPPTPPYLMSNCTGRYSCGSGECVDLHVVCDSKADCADGSDEGGKCDESCTNTSCSLACRATPRGEQCACRAGAAARAGRCVDINECASWPCAQRCTNTEGSFVCGCFWGYRLGTDGRRCKALFPPKVITATPDGEMSDSTEKYYSRALKHISLDYNRSLLYGVTQQDELVMAARGGTRSSTLINLGTPTALVVEWVTGNLYFATRVDSYARLNVCHFVLEKCARLGKLNSTLPLNSEVTTMAVDPSSHRLFYSVYKEKASVLYWSSLVGERPLVLAELKANCTGLAVDINKRRIYVAQMGASIIFQIGYEGNVMAILTHQTFLKRPHTLTLLADDIYFLEHNTSQINYCTFFDETCHPYVHRTMNTDTYALSHPSIQRGDLVNDCAGNKCDNLCVPSDNGPKCLCYDGSFVENGKECTLEGLSEVPKFKFVSLPTPWRWRSSRSFTVPVVVVLSIVTALGLFIFLRKKCKHAFTTAVRFRNTSASTSGADDAEATVHFHTEDGGVRRRRYAEYVNPLQNVRSLLVNTLFRNKRPVGTAGLHIDVPTRDDRSTTPTSTASSEPDYKDTRQFLPKP
uniref:Vitellogenin receptor n=1 Tax=Conopomorpha sinensis TaxID=940481 RepID=A0A4Y1KB20_9NEOP|nr:vitellogenin receptor [Conopomorpha sinensis]